MTKEALGKLNEKQMEYCKTMSVVISSARENGAKLDYERACGKLRGFLECLCQMKIITGGELRALYMWFMEKDRGDSTELP